MKRLIFASFAIATAFAFSPGQAGETSKFEVLGFTENGTHFAFEEFGISDGIGLPYSRIFAVDVKNDRWVKGSPVRISMKEEDVTEPEEDDFERVERQRISNTRAASRSAAQSFLEPLGPLGHGSVRAYNPRWELNSNRHIVRFTPVDLVPHDDKAWRLELEEIPFKSREDCYGNAELMKGFRLRLTDEVTGISRLINDDKGVPKSRPCPLGYQIEQVFTHQGDDSPMVFAILVRFQTVGFEGPDGRLLAITGRL